MTTQYLCNSSQISINNLTISHVGGNSVSIGHSVERSERQGLRLLLDNISKSAFHDAADRGDPPKCHPDTRVALRDEIMEWIQAPAAMRKLILWMYGPAGSGKTAIAQSIAEECMKRGLLAASFFFGRTAPGRDDTTRVITTIAYQISQFLPQIENHLFTAIERDQTIFDRTLATQMQVLVIEPLNSILAALAGPIFIVLDGLDESGPNARAQTDLLNVIGTAIHALQHIPLIFLIASRPEHELREAFKGTLLHSLMRPLELNNRYNPDTDIELYFTSMFRRIYDKHLREDIHLPSPWPSKDDVHRLVSTASGQFIFAATVVKFIDSIRHHPAERLKIIFGLSTPGNETPFTLLDALYYRILSSVAEPAKVLQILTMHVLRLRDANVILGSTIETIEALLGLNVRRVLVDMHALVFVPPPGKDYVLGAELQLHHASFHDFLMDRSRCHEFFIDVSQAHIDLTWRWWEVISNYQFPSELALFDCLHNFVHHCSKSPAGILAENLARFDLKELLRKHYASWDLLSSPWNAFFECVDQQAGDRDDISLRMRTEFDTFFLDCLSKYPAALQTYFPTILAHSMSGGKADIVRLLLYGSIKSITECNNIFRLDSTLLKLANNPPFANNAFSALFQDECRAGKYYVCDRSYLALANKIIGIILPKPGEDDRQIHFKKNYFLDHEVLYLEDGSLCIGLCDPKLLWFPDMLRKTPQDLDLATLLRERALQYDGCDITPKGGSEWIARASLNYIKRCGIPYLNHVHPPDRKVCIICEFCLYFSVVDLDWQNDPQADAAAFISSSVQHALSRTGEVGDHPNDLDEARNPSSVFPSNSEAFSVAELPLKPKRKREEQSTPAGLWRSTRLRVKKAAS